MRPLCRWIIPPFLIPFSRLHQYTRARSPLTSARSFFNHWNAMINLQQTRIRFEEEGGGGKKKERKRIEKSRTRTRGRKYICSTPIMEKGQLILAINSHYLFIYLIFTSFFFIDKNNITYVRIHLVRG